MNVERLHAIARAVKDDLTKTNVETNLQQMINALSQLVNNPQQPQFQQQVAGQREALSKGLRVAPSNDFSPTWRQVLEAIGAASLLGQSILDRIEAVFALNAMTPAVAMQRLQEIMGQLTTMRTAVDQLLSALNVLKIGSEVLEAGECEIGVLIPRAYVHNELPRFISELNEVNEVLGVFDEIVTGSRAPLQINTLSSSDLTIFLAQSSAVGAAVAAAVKFLLDSYKNLLEIRKLHVEMAKQGVPEANLKGIEQHAEGVMDNAIGEIVDKVMKDFCRRDTDQARQNELKIELRLTLDKIANRIDREFNLEVRAGPAKPQDGQEETKQQERDIATISDAARTLQFMKLEGKPLLSLPEKAEREPGSGSKTPEARRTPEPKKK